MQQNIAHDFVKVAQLATAVILMAASISCNVWILTALSMWVQKSSELYLSHHR